MGTESLVSRYDSSAATRNRGNLRQLVSFQEVDDASDDCVVFKNSIVTQATSGMYLAVLPVVNHLVELERGNFGVFVIVYQHAGSPFIVQQGNKI